MDKEPSRVPEINITEIHLHFMPHLHFGNIIEVPRAARRQLRRLVGGEEAEEKGRVTQVRKQRRAA